MEKKKEKQKMLSINMMRGDFHQYMRGPVKHLSFSGNCDHDFRLTTISDGYLKNPQDMVKNIYWKHKAFDDVPFSEMGGDRAMEIAKFFTASFEKKYTERQPNNQKLRKDTQPLMSGVVSFSSEWFPDNSKDKDALHKTLNRFVFDTFGTILTSSTHMDETQWHYSFQTTNVNRVTGKLNSRELDFAVLQTDLANYLQSKNMAFGHVRGLTAEQKMNAAEYEKHLKVMDAKRRAYELLCIEYDHKEMEHIKLKDINSELREINTTIRSESLDYLKGFKKEIIDWSEMAQTEGLPEAKRMQQMVKLVQRVGDYLKKGHFQKMNKSIDKLYYHMDKISKKLTDHDEQLEQLEKLKKSKTETQAKLNQERDEALQQHNAKSPKYKTPKNTRKI